MRKNKIIAIICILLGIIAVIIGYQIKNTNNKSEANSTTIVQESEQSVKQENSTTKGTTTKENYNTEASSLSSTKPISNSGTTKQITTTKANQTTTKAATTTTTTTKPSSINVTISITCKNAINYGLDYPLYMLNNKSVSVKDGATVFDVINSVADISYNSKTYIKGINGLMEKQAGPSSGWMYRVNGVAPQKPASNYTLKNGDNIEWYYVTSPNDN